MPSVSPLNPDLPNSTPIHCENCGAIAHLVHLRNEAVPDGVTQIWTFSCEGCGSETERKAD